MADTETGFGDLDGEPIELVAVKVTGSGLLDRLPGDGERLVLAIEGNVSGPPTIKRVDGRLMRIHTLKIELLAEPVDQLVEQVEELIREVQDRHGGVEPLPFDGEDGPEDPTDPGEDDEP